LLKEIDKKSQMKRLITISSFEGEITYELASFGERLGARLIDVLIMMIPSWIIPIIPSWLYWALLQSGKRQATVGQRALGIKVVDLEGSDVSFGQATGRFFSMILSAMIFLIGYFMFFFNDKRQCLHDLISGCVVVKENPIEENVDLSRHLID
jgi:uncharacterized RDD family membrane protein YckC